MQCIDAVYDELHQIVDSIQMAELLRYQTLRERIREVVHVMLGECRMPARRMVIDWISMEQSFLNTAHPDFIGGGKAIQRILQIRAQRQLQQQQAQSSSSLGFGDDDWAVMNSAGISHIAPPNAAMRDIPPELQAQFAQQYQRERERERKKKEEEAAARLKELQRREAEERARREKERQHAAQSPPASSQSQQSGGLFGSLFSRFGAGNESSPAQSVPPKDFSNPQLVSSSSSRTSGAAQPQAQPGRMAQMPSTITSGAIGQDDFQTELIKILLDSYFSIVRNNVRDKVPKTIMHFMVNKSKETLQSELVKTLYKDNLMDLLLEEAPDVAEKRAKCQQLLEVLQKASSILSEISESPL